MKNAKNLKHLVIEAASETVFENIALLNLETRELEIFTSTPSSIIPLHWKEKNKFNYDIQLLSECIIPDEVKMATHDMSIENIRIALENTEKYTRCFNIIDDNTEIYSKKITCSYFDKENQLVLITCTDVTEAQAKDSAKNLQIKEAVEYAERADNIKTEFLSRMSHDIRTPLNGIIGMTELATENVDRPDKIYHYLERIQYASKHLLSMVQDILDMSRIETGITTITSEYFNMNEIVAEVFSTLSEEAENKRIDFSNKIADNLYYGFKGDPIHIKQILVNLLSNGIKYTNVGGKVELHISSDTTPSPRTVSQVVFTITDSGIGISTDFQKHMFDPFEQGYDVTGTYTTGAGLGLSIVKKLVSLMNGTISVSSQLGIGTTFIVTIPLVKMDDHDELIDGLPVQKQASDHLYTNSTSYEKSVIPQANNEKNSNIKFNGQRILIVEDNEINMEIARTILSSAGLKYESAWNGQEAVELVKKKAPDYFSAILMDIRMPVMDGREATRRIRMMQRSDSKKLPIIALSADAFHDEVKASQSAGMDDYIIKPVNKNELLLTLKKFI